MTSIIIGILEGLYGRHIEPSSYYLYSAQYTGESRSVNNGLFSADYSRGQLNLTSHINEVFVIDDLRRSTDIISNKYKGIFGSSSTAYFFRDKPQKVKRPR